MGTLLTIIIIFGLSLIIDAITINIIYKLGSESEERKHEIKNNSIVSAYTGMLIAGSAMIISVIAKISLISYLLIGGTLVVWLISTILYIQIFKR